MAPVNKIVQDKLFLYDVKHILHSSRDRSRRYWKVQGRRWDMQVMII
jgi:hypothetical protein